MSYITEIFDRLNLQHISKFLLHGVECVEIDTATYKERLEAAGKFAFEMIEKRFPDREECDKISGDVHHYVNVTQNVYMEIGIQCGAILAMNLLIVPQKE